MAARYGRVNTYQMGAVWAGGLAPFTGRSKCVVRSGGLAHFWFIGFRLRTSERTFDICKNRSVLSGFFRRHARDEHMHMQQRNEQFAL